jgi:hypothetical protein
MDPRTAQIGPSAEPSVDDLAWQLFGSRVGDQHAILIWVDAVDESDPVQGVGVGTGIVRAQALFDPLQFCFAAGGPDDLLDAHIVDAACPGVSCARKYLEASRRQDKRRLRLVQRDMAFEHIAVEVHRTIQVGLS